MKRFDLRRIMLKAWELFRKEHDLSFAECLHRAWLSAKAVEINEKRIKTAKQAAGIEEPTATWNEWKKAGYEVIHGVIRQIKRCLLRQIKTGFTEHLTMV